MSAPVALDTDMAESSRKAVSEDEDSATRAKTQIENENLAIARNSNGSTLGSPEVKKEQSPSPVAETSHSSDASRASLRSKEEKLQHESLEDSTHQIKSEPDIGQITSRSMNTCGDQGILDIQDIHMQDCTDEKPGPSQKTSSRDREICQLHEAHRLATQGWNDERATLDRKIEELQSILQEDSKSHRASEEALRKQIQVMEVEHASNMASWKAKEKEWIQTFEKHTLKRKREDEEWDERMSKLIRQNTEQEKSHQLSMESLKRDKERLRIRLQGDKAKATKILEARVGELDSQLKARAKENDSIRQQTSQELKEKDRKFRDLTTSWRQALKELARLQNEDWTFSADDESVISKWGQLDYAIRNLASLYFKGSHRVGRLHGKQADFFSSVLKDYETYIQDEAKSPEFFRAVIWRLLYDKLLAEPSMAWGESAAQSMAHIRECISDKVHELKDCKEKYHKWRAQTGQLLHRFSWSTVRVRDVLAEGMGVYILPFSPKESGSGVESMIVKICTMAVDLAAIFGRSRAIYEVFCSSSDDQLMLLPGLAKHGDSEAEYYEEVIYLVQGQSVRFR